MGTQAETDRRKTAVIYLRVSTKRQVKKAYNPDGYSLPAQQGDCERKAAALNADVVHIFIDRGETAKTADRPDFQNMLAFLAANPIDFLIVHKLDRWARNREDDILLNLKIRQTGAQLISATENIDETPAGRMLHGILATMNEFYSANLTGEVLKGMGQKARDGGTPGLAPIGYLNIEERLDDGTRVRTVGIDPERGPLISQAFDFYATGNYSLNKLIDEMTERGLRTRPNKNHAPKELTVNQMSRILHNPYYVGDLTFHGVVYAGRHQPLVPRSTYERVQEVLDMHNKAGERERVHSHLLKGTAFCGRCGSRLSLDKAKKDYMYFYCLGRARGNGCTLPYVPVDEVAEQIAAGYDGFSIPPEELELTRDELHDYLDTEAAKRDREARAQRQRLTNLDGQRTRLLRAHLADAVPLDLLKEEQTRIAREQRQAETVLEALEADNSQVLVTYDEVAELLASLSAKTYRSLDPASQRLLNQTLIYHALIDVDEPPKLQLTDLGRAVQDIVTAPQVPGPAGRRMIHKTTDTANPQLTEVGAGSRSDHLERVTGIEPA